MNACDERGRLHLCQRSCRPHKALPHLLVFRIASVDLVISYWEICGFAAVLTAKIGGYVVDTELVYIIEMLVYIYQRRQEEMFDHLM